MSRSSFMPAHARRDHDIPDEHNRAEEQGEPITMPNGDWQVPGYPFPDDYRDERTDAQLVQDLRRVRNQVGNLGWRGRDEPVRRQLLSRFQQRMQDRGEQLGIEAVPRAGAADALVVSGELLIRSEQLEDSRVDSFLHDVGFERRQVLDGLDNRVMRLVAPGMEAARCHEIARFLRRQGMQVSLHHVTPLGQLPTPVGKVLASPEPTSSSVAFATRQRTQVEVAVIDTGVADQPRDDGWLHDQDVPRNSQNIDPVYYPRARRSDGGRRTATRSPASSSGWSRARSSGSTGP